MKHILKKSFVTLYTLNSFYSQNVFATDKDLSTEWKSMFGACINSEGSYTDKVREFSQIAGLKLKIQLQHLNELDAGRTYSLYLNAVIGLRDLAQSLQKLRVLDTDKYFDGLFKDKRFQDFASSQNYSILNLLRSSAFFDKTKNRDPKFLKLMSKIDSADSRYNELRSVWNETLQLIENPKLVSYLNTLKHVNSKYQVDTSIIDPDLAKQLIDFANKILGGKSSNSFSLTETTLLSSVGFPQDLPMKNYEYLNNYARIAAQIVQERIERSYIPDESIYFFKKKESLVPVRPISKLDIELYRQKYGNAELINVMGDLVKRKKIENSFDSFANYLNEIERPSRFAFDEFLIKDYWQKSENNYTYNLKIGRLEYSAKPQQMAAIDGLARTLVGEAMSCQEGGSSQYEAIGLVFANRSLAIQEYQQREYEIVRNQADSNFFQKQLDVLFSSNPNAQFERYLSNPLRGLADFGRRDLYGYQLHTVSQALSAPRQFDSWQASSMDSYSLEKLIGKQPESYPRLNLEIPRKINFNEAPVYQTVLCPRGSDDRIIAKKSILFDQALDVAAQVVFNQKDYLKRYAFIDNSGKPIPEVYFYTHGVNLGFAHKVQTQFLLDRNTNTRLPLLKAKAGACDDFRLFKATPSNQYLSR